MGALRTLGVEEAAGMHCARPSRAVVRLATLASLPLGCLEPYRQRGLLLLLVPSFKYVILLRLLVLAGYLHSPTAWPISQSRLKIQGGPWVGATAWV